MNAVRLFWRARVHAIFFFAEQTIQEIRSGNPNHLDALGEKLQHYSWIKAHADLKAGTNVAASFASSRFTMVGSSNATAVMVLSVFLGMPEGMNRLACLCLLVCMVGLFLRKASTPQLQEYAFNETGQLAEIVEGPRHDLQISSIHVEEELFFGATDLFRDEIRRMYADTQLKVIVLRMRNAHHLDATSVVASVGNPNLSTRNALQRAAVLLGREHANVRIFHSMPVVSSPQTA